jgi:hypothetical protein
MEPILICADQVAETGQQLGHQDFAKIPYGLHSSTSSPVVRQPKHMQQEDMLHLLKCAVSCIQIFGFEQGVNTICDENLKSAIKTFLLDPSQFVAGNIRHHLLA